MIIEYKAQIILPVILTHLSVEDEGNKHLLQTNTWGWLDWSSDLTWTAEFLAVPLQHCVALISPEADALGFETNKYLTDAANANAYMLHMLLRVGPTAEGLCLKCCVTMFYLHKPRRRDSTESKHVVCWSCVSHIFKTKNFTICDLASNIFIDNLLGKLLLQLLCWHDEI